MADYKFRRVLASTLEHPTVKKRLILFRRFEAARFLIDSASFFGPYGRRTLSPQFVDET
jgi:hypothetical protein